MKIIHVFHTGSNIGYYHTVLKRLNKYKKYKAEVQFIGIANYVRDGNQPADVLSYQTFPDQNNQKFNPNLVKLSDKLFHEFDGHKIIVDTHTNGNIDAFERFLYSRPIPRVKCFPSDRFLDNYNVVLALYTGFNHSKLTNEFYEYLTGSSTPN